MIRSGQAAGPGDPPAIAQLDERQARVVELRYFAGLKMSEVAEVLGVSKRSANGDWARARIWLEQELSG